MMKQRKFQKLLRYIILIEMKGVYALKFLKLAEDHEPFHTQWYAIGKDVVICGHEDSGFDNNHCASCFKLYQNGEDWIMCLALCQQ